MLSKINKDLVPMKAHYFFFNAGTGPVQPFLSTYARQLGFSAGVIGLIYTILPICGMIAKPIAGGIADRFKAQKLMFLAGQLITAAAFLTLNYLPGLPVERNVHFSCDNSDAVFDTSPTNNTIDNLCTINDVQADTTFTHCKLNCQMNEKFWDVVINVWNYSNYQSTRPSTLEFTTIVNKSLIDIENNILYFPFKEINLDGRNTQTKCPSLISTHCAANCEDYKVNDLIVPETISNDATYGTTEFWGFLIVMIFGWVGQAIVVSVADAVCFQLLGNKPNRYGYQRLFGSLGWGLFSVIAGIMVDSLSSNSSYKNFESAFFLSLAFLLVDFAVSTRIKCSQTKQSSNILKDVGLLLTDLRIIIFLLWCIAVGMCTGLIWNFLNLLIEDLAEEQGCESQQWIKTLEGVIQAIQTLAGEIPFFFWSGKILKRIGHVHSMSLILMVIGIRYILYSIIPNPWFFLPVELLNGLTFGLFYACMASYASIIAPPGTESTMQGLVGAIFEGAGVSLGSFVGGLIYQKYGGPWTFRLFGIGSLIVCLFHFFVQLLLQRRSKTTSDFEARYTTPIEALNSLYDDQQQLSLVD